MSKEIPDWRNDFDRDVYDEVLSRGLSNGLGERNGQMCIEAAICCALGLEHADNPKCVAADVRQFKIKLNDCVWESTTARAQGLQKLGIAQLGTAGMWSTTFSYRINQRMLTELIPAIMLELLPESPAVCECVAKIRDNSDEQEVVEVFRALADTVMRSAKIAEVFRALADTVMRSAKIADDHELDHIPIGLLVGMRDVADSLVDTGEGEDDYADWNMETVIRCVDAFNSLAKGRRKWDPPKQPMRDDDYLFRLADMALEVLQELKAPGCELLNS